MPQHITQFCIKHKAEKIEQLITFNRTLTTEVIAC